MNLERIMEKSDQDLHYFQPESLLSQCIKYVAEHLSYVDSFFGLPDLIGEQIFKKAESSNKFDLDDQLSLHALSVFTLPYEELVVYGINLCYQHLGVNYCQDHIHLFTALREIDLTGCGLGDDHDLLSHIGQLLWLTNVSLRENSLSDKGIQRFTSPYRVCKRGPADLTRLDISGNWEITGKSYKYLNPFLKLSEVDVTSTQVRGNAELLKTWKFKPVKCDDSVNKIENKGWANGIVQKWMKTARDKVSQVKIRTNLTQTQQFYKKKRKVQTQNLEDQPVQPNNIGYRLMLVRINESCPTKNNLGDKNLLLSKIENKSICKTHNSGTISTDERTCDDLDTELIDLYKNCAQSVIQKQKLTLKSALQSDML